MTVDSKFSPPSSHSGRSDRTQGSALLLTLLITSLLLTLVLSLTIVVRMEMRRTETRHEGLVARQNARLAAQLAVGALQMHTGPDRRITVSADLVYPTATNPRWTGVLGNTEAADYSETPGSISNIAARELQWLVSGNESVSVVADSEGTITSSTTITHSPVSTVTTAQRLVGEGTVDSSASTTDYVEAPLVDIRTPSTTSPTGGYAWWVGDQSTKAKINLQPSYENQPSATEETDFEVYSFITAQRSGIENVDDGAGAPIGTAFDSDEALRVAHLEQLPLMQNGANSTQLEDAIRSRFHDLTTDGYGVLADAFAGGLKKDLTADAAISSSSGSSTRPADDDPIFPRANGSDPVPTWGMLRSFPRTTHNGGELTPRPFSMTEAGISPIISYASLGMDVYLDNSNQIQVALYPIVILWNPYPAPIKATNYDLGFRVNEGSINPDIRIVVSGTSSSTLARLDLTAGEIHGGSSAGSSPDGYFTFQIQGTTMTPGETHVYALRRSESYSEGNNVLTLGYDSKLTNHVFLSDPSLLVTDATLLTTGTLSMETTVSAGSSFETVLAEAGSLSSPDTTTGWYQFCGDNRFGIRADRRGSDRIIRTPVLMAFLAPFSTGATSSFLQTHIMEQRFHFNSSRNHTGALGPTGVTRWLVTGNPRAPIVCNTEIENTTSTRGGILFGSNLTNQDSSRYDVIFPHTGRTIEHRTGVGGTISTSTTDYRPSMLYDVLESEDRFLSLGQLQHAPLSRYGFDPTNAFGNSWAPVSLPRSRSEVANQVRDPWDSSYNLTQYDLSWHLNRAIWDRYFVSGVPSDWTDDDLAAGRTLPNARMTVFDEDGGVPSGSDLIPSSSGATTYDTAAAHLLVDGAFNLNSTSEQAWRAFLSATLGLPENSEYADGGDMIEQIVPVPRFSNNLSQPGYEDTMGIQTNFSTRYYGNRGLEFGASAYSQEPVEELVANLAKSIVERVKERGPFLSVSQFVNRALEDSTTRDHSLKGALQSALDNMDGTGGINPISLCSASLPVKETDMPVTGWDPLSYTGYVSQDSDNKWQRSGARFAGASKYLTQADLLSLLGPALTVRGDTFVIRAYGESRTPQSQDVTSQAWCEVVVQRVPTFVDETGNDPEDEVDNLSVVNSAYGRRYEIVSFHWVDPDNI